MRLLLDENLPKRLKNDFPNHEVFTVAEKQWRGKKNGDLLKLMLENEFVIGLSSCSDQSPRVGPLGPAT